MILIAWLVGGIIPKTNQVSTGGMLVRIRHENGNLQDKNGADAQSGVGGVAAVEHLSVVIDHSPGHRGHHITALHSQSQFAVYKGKRSDLGCLNTITKSIPLDKLADGDTASQSKEDFKEGCNRGSSV